MGGTPSERCLSCYWHHPVIGTNVLNVKWEGVPAFTEGKDRMEPTMYRISGGETIAKIRAVS